MNSKKFAKRMKDSGVSPVIATILMVAITVVLAAVLYVMVSGFTHSPGAANSAGMTNSQGSTSWTITVSSVSASNIPNSNLRIVVTGASGGTPYDGSSGTTGLVAGTAAEIGTGSTNYVTVTYTPLSTGETYLSAGDTFVLNIVGSTLNMAGLSGATVTLYNGGSTLGSTTL